MKKLIICDLDGTLYYQIPVQILMFFELLFFYTIHIWRWRELFLIYIYRKQHNNGKFYGYKYLARKFSSSPKKVEQIIENWFFDRPLKWITLFADKKLLSILSTKNTVIFSDYPTEKKLQALSFEPLEQFYFNLKTIREMKPSPQGLFFIQKKYNINSENIYVIGDRYSKDGKAAENFNCPYIILKKVPWKRYKQYKEINNVLQL